MHGQGTIAIGTRYFPCILELFAWLWSYSLRGNMASFIPDQYTRPDINSAAEVPQEPPSSKCQLPLDSPMEMTLKKESFTQR